MGKVRVLYEFHAEDANELTTFLGEELTIINPNVFEGWIQCKNSQGRQGIVPATYVEFLNESDDDIPPPPGSHSNYDFGADSPSWNMPAPSSTYQTPDLSDLNPTISVQENLKHELSSPLADTDWNSFLTDKNETNSSSFDTNNNNLLDMSPIGSEASTSTFISTANTMGQNSYNAPANNIRSNRSYEEDDSEFSDDEQSVNNATLSNTNGSFYANKDKSRTNTSISSAVSNPASSGTIKLKSKNSYGLDVFLLLGSVKKVLDGDKFSTIILNDKRQSVWKRISPSYEIQILGYHSDKKYHGVKKFTTYEIQAKIFPQRVKRRYNHFDWLHDRLVEKYPNICIPSLPGKAVTGNFDDEFLNKRRSQLELWLNKMASHPVVGQSEVFVHFLQCDEGSSKWKAGKRKAEKDDYRGAQWFCTLTVPGESVDTTNAIKEKVDRFSRDCTNLENCVKNVSACLEKLSNINSTVLRKEYVHLGKKLDDFGIALNKDSLEAPYNHELTDALITTGNTYTQIGNMFGEQPKTDINPLLDRFHLYKGIIQQMPEIVQFEKQSIQTYEEFQAKPEKLEGKSLMEIAPRREIISHVTFAEINQFNTDKVEHFNQYMKSFIEQQITFYTEITECLKRAHASFNKIPSNKSSEFSSSFRR